MLMTCRLALPLLLLAMLVPLRFALGQSPVPEGAEVERIADGFQFVEGPVWYDGGLLFSDIPANRVYRWTEGGGVEVFREPSGHSNGLALDAEGRLLLAQHGPRRVARIEDDDSETELAGEYAGMRLNSPNDLTLHSDGSIYFTDPTWGWQSNQSDGPPELGFMGVFRIDPEGELHLAVDSLFYPNGIVFSPDESTLYVSTSHQRTVVAFDVDDHTLSGGRVFASLQGNDAADGMKVDAEGRLYVTGPGGVWIYAPDGTLLDRIDVPGQTTNLAWGDADGGTLYITSGTGLYRIRLR
jgi:gluconolactonase